MTSRLKSHLEVATNSATILAVLLIGFVVVRYYVFPREPVQARAEMKINAAALGSQPVGGTYFVAVQEGCQFCAQSMSFYQKLLGEAGLAHRQVVFIAPGPVKDTRAYLDGFAVKPKEIRRETFRLVGITGTPVVFYVGKNGQVAKHWVGKLPPSKEDEVLSFVKGDQL